MRVTPGSVGAVALLAALAMIFGYKHMTRTAEVKPPPYLNAPIPDSTPATTPPIVKLEPKTAPVAVPMPRERPCCLSAPPLSAKPAVSAPAEKRKVKAKTKKAKARKAAPAPEATPAPENKELKRRVKNSGCGLFKQYADKYGVETVREYIREHLRPSIAARAAQCKG